MRRTLKVLVGALASVGLLALAGATPTLAADDAFTTREMRQMVEHLRDGSITPADARASCLQALGAAGKSGDYREFISTFLDVSDDEALPALCRAVVNGITAGSLSEAQLMPAIDPTGDDSEVIEFGRLLRVLFFSHRTAEGVAQ